MRASNRISPRKGNPAALKLWGAKKKGSGDPFLWFLRCAKRRIAKKGATNLNPRYLKILFANQDGKCPLTGWALILPHSSECWEESNANPRRASLDRIDNSKGYVQGNVRFIAVIANYAKHAFTDADVVSFAQAVIEHHSKLKS